VSGACRLPKNGELFKFQLLPGQAPVPAVLNLLKHWIICPVPIPHLMTGHLCFTLVLTSPRLSQSMTDKGCKESTGAMLGRCYAAPPHSPSAIGQQPLMLTHSEPRGPVSIPD
jgi:hypothetical protein